MINIGILLDVCGISYTDIQLAKLDKLVNELLKKLSLQKFDSDKSIQQHDSTLDSEGKSRNEDFSIETKLKSFEEFYFKSEPNCNITITEEITESAIEIKEEFPKDPFASLEIFNNSENDSDIMLEENKSFVCEACDTSFKQKSDCISHIATVHEGKKPFKCDECVYEFLQCSSLNKHITAIHERKKPFKCNECGATFTQKSSLKIHISTTIHEGKKPFKCNECCATFTQNKSLKVHIKAIHDGKKHGENKEKQCFNCSLPSCNYSAPKGFHGFPKNEKMRKKWQRLCGMKEVKKWICMKIVPSDTVPSVIFMRS